MATKWGLKPKISIQSNHILDTIRRYSELQTAAGLEQTFNFLKCCREASLTSLLARSRIALQWWCWQRLHRNIIKIQQKTKTAGTLQTEELNMESAPLFDSTSPLKNGSSGRPQQIPGLSSLSLPELSFQSPHCKQLFSSRTEAVLSPVTHLTLGLDSLAGLGR